jgi:hypothetical protein
MSKADRWTYLGSGIGLVVMGIWLYFWQPVGLI